MTTIGKIYTSIHNSITRVKTYLGDSENFKTINDIKRMQKIFDELFNLKNVLSHFLIRINEILVKMAEIQVEVISPRKAPRTAFPTTDIYNPERKFSGFKRNTNSNEIENKQIKNNLNQKSVSFRNIQFYNDIGDIPTMSFGLVVVCEKPRVIFKYTKKYHVLCSEIRVNDISKNSRKTNSCKNTNPCPRKGHCKFYHDPLKFTKHTGPDDIQTFNLTNQLVSHKNFGSYDLDSSFYDGMNIHYMYNFIRYFPCMMLQLYKFIHKKTY